MRRPLGAGEDARRLGFPLAAPARPDPVLRRPGINSTFFWIDPEAEIGVVVMMQPALGYLEGERAMNAKAVRTTRTSLVIVTATFLAMAPSAFGQPKASPRLPNTDAGSRVAAWLAAFGSGDDARMRQYFAENLAPEALARRPIEERLAMARDMRSAFGEVELRKVVRAEANLVTVVLATRDGFVELSFECEPRPPHRLLRIFGEPTDDPDLPPPAEVTEAEAVVAIEKAVAEAAAADEFSGTVLVAREGRPLMLRAWGLASVEHGTANRTDTMYNLGSVNKLFTRLAIGQLVQDGKLACGDTLGKALPEYPNAEARQKVTIRHLIEMRSGIGDFFGKRFDATSKDRFRTNADYLPMFAADPLAFEPGSRRLYSNGGYAVLGAVIERVSGRSYYDYVRERIFTPAGMTATDSFEADVPVPNLAEGYTRLWGPEEKEMDGPRRKNIYSRPARGSAAGGGDTPRPRTCSASSMPCSPTSCCHRRTPTGS